MNYIFDLGGVLIDLDMEGMKRRCAECGIDPSLFFVKVENGDNASAVCNGMSASATIAGYQVGETTSEQFVDTIISLCPTQKRPQEVVDLWNSCLGNLPKERLDLIRALRAQGHRTYLLSNTNDIHWQYIVNTYFSEPGYSPQDLFDDVFLSHEMHLAKPAPEIYREVLRRIGSAGSDCLFIDDSTANVDAAQKEGIPSLWLNLETDSVLTLCLQHR